MITGSIQDPGAAFLGALRQALTAYAIDVRDTMDVKWANGAIRDSAVTRLFELRSPPLRTILPVMEKPSQNQIAEIFFKTLGLEKTGVGSADSARRVVQQRLGLQHVQNLLRVGLPVGGAMQVAAGRDPARQ